MLNRAIENAQRKVEAHNFDIRKHLLEYDNVANDQRRVVYQQRSDLMEVDDIQETIETIRSDVFEKLIDRYVPPGSIDEQWELEGLQKALDGEFGIALPLTRWLAEDEMPSRTTLIIGYLRYLNEVRERARHAESRRAPNSPSRVSTDNTTADR